MLLAGHHASSSPKTIPMGTQTLPAQSFVPVENHPTLTTALITPVFRFLHRLNYCKAFSNVAVCVTNPSVLI